MSPQDLLDAALGQTSPDLAADPDSADRLSRLSASLRFLLDDGDDEIEVPPGLARLTAELVADRRAQRARAAREYGPVILPFRWTDLAVAAGIFFAGILTLLPAILRSREKYQVASCANNLRGMGVSLNHYRLTHGHYPEVDPAYPAGASLVMLHEAGDLSDASHAACPNAGPCSINRNLPAYSHPGVLASRSPERVRGDVEGGYAINPGYYRGGGLVHTGVQDATTPLLGDPPPHDGDGVVHEGNSPNHGGGGQNILFSGGHVGWLHNRYRDTNDPDIYLNDNLRAAPGHHPTDIVLLPSVFSIGKP